MKARAIALVALFSFACGAPESPPPPPVASGEAPPPPAYAEPAPELPHACDVYLKCTQDCGDTSLGSLTEEAKQECVEVRCAPAEELMSEKFLGAWGSACAELEGSDFCESFCDDGCDEGYDYCRDLAEKV